MTKRPSVQTQFIIFVLFGDVILPLGGQVWTASLLQMLDVLGVNAGAARSTLSRLRQKGWVKSAREGRLSVYTLTPKARRLLAEGGQRIFEPRRQTWDGQWHLVVYSLPESKRQLRNNLRKRLAWLGFGRLAPGTWISPYDRLTEVGALLDELNARPYTQLFAGLRLVGEDPAAVVQQCWDLRSLNQQYAKFLARWQPEYAKCQRAVANNNGPTPAACFAQRFWITHEYSPFPRLDPNLPTELLPEGWLGGQVAEIFHNYRELLSPRAQAFVETVLQHPNGQA